MDAPPESKPSPDDAARRAATLRVVEWRDGETHRQQDEVVVEEPLEIRVKGVPVSVTRRPRLPSRRSNLAIAWGTSRTNSRADSGNVWLSHEPW